MIVALVTNLSASLMYFEEDNGNTSVIKVRVYKGIARNFKRRFQRYQAGVWGNSPI